MLYLLKKIPYIIYIALFAHVFFVSAWIFSYHGSVNSPDESANRVFAQSWAQELSVSISSSIQHPRAYPLFPRSTVPNESGITPAGFVGMPIILGSVSWITGENGIYFVTVISTIFAAIAFWYIVKRIFSDRVAYVATLLFLCNPAVLYYSVRGLFPNVIMLNMIIVSIASVWFAMRNNNRIAWCIGGISAMLALFIRPLEPAIFFILSALSLIVWGGAHFRKIGFRVLGTIIAVVILGFGARLFNVLPGGYSFVEIHSISSVLFPFGFYPSRIWTSSTQFIIGYFFPLTFLSGAGVVWWLIDSYRRSEYRREIVAYLTVVLPMSIWLIALYGSWAFSDNLQDPTAVTMGSSFVRYWLPCMIFFTPFIVYIIDACAERWNINRRTVSIGVVTVLAVFGVWRSVRGVEGLQWLRSEFVYVRTTKEDVLSLVSKDGVIAVRAWDKIFFPDRTVIQPFPRDPRIFNALRELDERGVPLFAFITSMNDADVLWIRDNGLQLDPIKNYGVHTLYKIVWNSKR